MTRNVIDIGTEGNDGTGDSIRESFRKTNENFQELYAVFGVGGQISFTTLSDTPDSLTPNTVALVNGSGTELQLATLGSNSDLDPTKTDTITFSYSQPGKLIISTAFTQVADDLSPALGGPLYANGYGIAGVGITSAAAQAINDAHDGVTGLTVDDLVITKGYADRRYVTSGLPIRVADEPNSVQQYTLTINQYIDNSIEILNHYDEETGTTQSGHGFDSGANGTAFIFNAQDTDPTGLTNGTTYYIRYETTTRLSLYASEEYAATDDELVAAANKLSISGAIAADDVHTIVDAGYDSTLSGNFLKDVALPRESVTRRQGDTMTGALFLNDHPGELAGEGAPNGDEDLQAATKYYVDNTAYSSPEVLHVSTRGDDSMAGVPNGKEGTSYTYAFKTINAAAQRADELIRAAGAEPGPYFQRLTYNSFQNAAEILTADVETPVFEQARSLIDSNREYVVKEISGYIAKEYPDFTYNIDICERDTGLILDAISLDINRGLNANYLTRQAAERYYSSVSGRKAITSQLTETTDAIETARDIIAAILQNQLFNQKAIDDITRAAIPVVTTTTNHGLVDGNIVVFKDIGGMTEIEGQKKYVRVTGDQTLELYNDAALTQPYDTSSFTGFTLGNLGLVYQTEVDQTFDAVGGDANASAQSAIADKFNLVVTIITNGLDAGQDIVYGSTYKIVVTNGASSFTDQTDPNNSDALPGKVIKGRNSGAIGQIVSFTNNDTTEATGGETNPTTFHVHLLSAKDFEVGEELEYGNFVKKKQVLIRVETGIYEEDYPIRIPANCSLKGDEFRRVIIRPKKQNSSDFIDQNDNGRFARVSQSKWAQLYFYRDNEFDGLQLTTGGTPFLNQEGTEQGKFGYHYLYRPDRPLNIGTAISNSGGYNTAANIIEENKEFLVEETIEFINANYPALVYSEDKCKRDTRLIIDALVNDLTKGGEEKTLEVQGSYHEIGYTDYQTQLGDSSQEVATEAAIQNISPLITALLSAASPSYTDGSYTAPASSITPDLSLGTGESGTVSLTGNLIDKIAFVFDIEYNPPKRNDEMDVFLMGDATIIRNVTVQGHGGFMCVLDPEGQVLTKSPYIQTASSFSKTVNQKTFAGGMYVDAYVGNLPTRVTSKTNAFQLDVRSAPGEGLRLRPPQLPCPFYVEGRRYQVNAISDYDSGQGTATLYLDSDSNEGTGYDETQFSNPVVARDIFLQTAGNRSMLANDFTQINDLGYGLVANNAAFSEQVSTFTYYCQAAMYANNGSEIRSLNGSNGYGNFGLIAEGADPNEIPDQVTLRDTMIQPAKVYTDGTYTNAFDEPSIAVYDLARPPTANSLIRIEHTGAVGSAGTFNYVISAVTNLSDIDGDGVIGEAGDVVVTGAKTVDAATISITTTASQTGTYNSVPHYLSSGSGTGATFNVTIDHGASPNTAVVSIDKVGSGYVAGETIEIAGTEIGGTSPANDLTINIDTIFGATAGTNNNIVYKLDLRADDTNATDLFGTLQDTVALDTIIDYSDNFAFIFDNVKAPADLVTRPSTAINFDESDTTTYRSIAFSDTDAFSQSLAADEVLTTFEAGFDFVEIDVDTANIGSGYGSAQGDTRLAIQPLTTGGTFSPDIRITADSTTSTVLQPGDPGYTGGMIFVWDGKLHQVTNYDTSGAFAFIEFTDVASSNINSSYGGSGLNSGIPLSDRTLKCGLISGTTAEITIAISLLRATGHDFTQIGTGSFNDSNYPNVILGDPENSLAEFYTDADTATSSQVWERRKGRVFFVSTDQNGFFRVGKFFSVDQATGDITFAGEIGLSNANALGFKRGVTINEFSADDAFTDDSGQAVPTEKATGGYINRVLGYNVKTSSQILGSGNRIGPGFLTLNGDTPMEGDLNLNSNKITGVGLPGSDGTAVTNKNYVDDNVEAFSRFELMRDIELNTPASDDIIVATGKKIIYTEPESGGLIANGDSISAAASGATGTVVDIATITDEVFGTVRKIVYTAVSGTFNSSTDTITNGTANAVCVNTPLNPNAGGPFDEIANASEATASDINVGVTRTASGAEYDLQIEAGAIENADVSASAAISQSKLAMNTAGTRTNATGIAQSDLGLATFKDTEFTETNGFVELQTASSTSTGIAPEKLQHIATDTVLGRSAAGNGAVSAVSFADILDQGGAIVDSNLPAYTSGTDVLLRTAAGTYTVKSLATGSTADTVALRKTASAGVAAGAIQAEAYIIGGTETYEILSESAATLTFKTPGQATILTAAGTDTATLVVDIPGNLDVGETGITTESTFQTAATTYTGEGFLATDWIYTKFIEANDERDGNSTGIGLGNDLGFTENAADTIIFVAGGTVTARVTSTGVESDSISSLTANTDLTLSGNGTGIVTISDSLDVNSIESSGTNSNLTLTANGTGVVNVNDTFTVSGTASFNGDVNIGDATTETVTFTARVDSNFEPDATANNRNIGNSARKWNTVYATIFDGTATTAQYADLAENYLADADYEPGTVLVFGGNKEVTVTNQKNNSKVAGVVSTNPAHLMNSALEGEHVSAIALQGRVPVKVVGVVQKGDMIVTSAIPGYAIANNNPNIGTVIGKAVGEKPDEAKGTVEVVIGRV